MDEAHFWSKVDKDGDCWEWLACKDSDGYGIYIIKRRNARAARVAYQLAFGTIPAGLQIDHLCRNRNCVNPAHLEAVTQRENILRGIGPTAENARKTHCLRGHEFTEANTRISGTRTERVCRRCHADKSLQRYYDRKAVA